MPVGACRERGKIEPGVWRGPRPRAGTRWVPPPADACLAAPGAGCGEGASQLAFVPKPLYWVLIAEDVFAIY